MEPTITRITTKPCLSHTEHTYCLARNAAISLALIPILYLSFSSQYSSPSLLQSFSLLSFPLPVICPLCLLQYPRLSLLLDIRCRLFFPLRLLQLPAFNAKFRNFAVKQSVLSYCCSFSQTLSKMVSETELASIYLLSIPNDMSHVYLSYVTKLVKWQTYFNCLFNVGIKWAEYFSSVDLLKKTGIIPISSQRLRHALLLSREVITVGSLVLSSTIQLLINTILWVVYCDKEFKITIDVKITLFKSKYTLLRKLQW